MKSSRAAVALCSVAFLLGAGGDPGVPAGVRTAKQQYDAAIAKAGADYQRQCRTAADRYVGELKVGLKLAMRDEKLDDANKLKAEIEAVQAATGSGKVEDTLNRFTGIWDLQWLSGEIIRYRFNGAVIEALAKPPANFVGKVEAISPNEVMVSLGGNTHRWTLAANRVYVEAWVKQPEGKPDGMAVGVREK